MTQQMNLEQKILMLRRQPVFSQLTHSEAQGLAELLKDKYYAPGDTVVTEGEHVDSVFFIVSGTADVRHVRIINGIEEVTSIAKLHEGESIGLNESGFYSLSGLRTATVVADTPLYLLLLSVAAFHGFALMNHRVNEIMKKNAAKILNIG